MCRIDTGRECVVQMICDASGREDFAAETLPESVHVAFFGDELAVVEVDFGSAAGEAGGVGNVVIDNVVAGGGVDDEGVGVAPLGGTARVGKVAFATGAMCDGADAVDG